MIPAHLYFFRIQNPIDLCLTLLCILSVNLLAFFIAFVVLSIRKSLKYWVFSDLITTKHILLHILVFSAAWFLFQSYLSLSICVAWYIWSFPLFRTDCHFLYLCEFQINERGKYKRWYADINPAAKDVQADPPPNASWNEILTMYHQKRITASAFDAESCADYHPKRAPFPLTAFLACLAATFSMVKNIIFDFGYHAVFENAAGFPFGFFRFNEILHMTAFFGALFLAFLWIGKQGTHETYKGAVLVVLLYLCILILYLGAGFGWF